MPFVLHQGARLYWKLEGEPDKPALVLLNSIGTDLGLYDLVAPELARRYRLLRMDARGHGASDSTPGEYSLDLLARDTLAVMDAAGIERATLCGLSLGGMVAMQAALQAPERVSALILACTSAKTDRATWENRIAMLRAGGMEAIAEAALQRFFSKQVRTHNHSIVETVRAGLLGMDPVGYGGCAAAVRDVSLTPHLGQITQPTLVIAGALDVSMPFPEHGELIAQGVPGAVTRTIATGHLCVLEDPKAFLAAISGFPVRQHEDASAETAAQTLFQAGLEVRRRVLGDPWVDHALAARTPFNADYQAMITRSAWQEIWSRPGLDHRTRRLLVVAICASLARWEEFRLHVRSGLQQGGFTQEDLKEVLMQTAVYAGVPAGNTGFSEAAEIIEELIA